MAWVAIETFDGVADGADLNGTSGGSGWSAAWTADASYDGTTVGNCEGTTSITCAGQNVDASRPLTTPVTAGIFHVTIKRSSVTTGEAGVVLRDGGNSRIRVTFETAEISLQNGAQSAEVQILASPSGNTCYAIDVEIDAANDRARARVDGGVWTTYLTVEAYTDIDDVRITTGSTMSGVFIFDDIKNGASVGPANLKTYDGLAKASVKTVNNLAIASVKTWGGLA